MTGEYTTLGYGLSPYASTLTTAVTPSPVSGTPDWPTLEVLIAWVDPPYVELEGWQDMTSLLRTRTPVRIRRGRDIDLDEFTAGTCSFELDNTDRRFDPSYTAGPWHGYLTPNRRVRVNATWNGITYPLFTGYLDGLEQHYERGDNDASVTVRASDAFRLLASRDFETAWPLILDQTDGSSDLDANNRLADPWLDLPTERSGARIFRILDHVGLPVSAGDFDPGASVVIADQPTDEKVLAYCQRVARTEFGRFYVAADGYAPTFRDRHAHRNLTWMSETQATFSDQAGTSYPYRDLSFDPADTRMVRNSIVRGRADTAPVVRRDRDSIGLYTQLEDDGSDLLFRDMQDAYDQASYLLERYHEPSTRIRSLSLKPRRKPATLWPAALGYEIGTRVAVERTPMQTGNVFRQVAHVEQVEHLIDLERKDWSTSWSLSPADTGLWFRLDQTDTDPDGWTIFADRNLSGNYEIVTLDASGNVLDQLTADPTYDSWWPQPNPTDPDEVMFVRTLAGVHDTAFTDLSVWTVSRSTRVATMVMAEAGVAGVTSGWTDYSHPEWSPDGTMIAVKAGTSSGTAIVTVLTSDWATADIRYATTSAVAGTSSGANSTTTLNDTTKAWSTNQWKGGGVQITGGTGSGQYRVVASNTATQLTVTAVWTTTPDATSTYSVTANVLDPAWSPDGATIVFCINGATYGSVCTVDSTGALAAGFTVLTSGQYGFYDPYYNPAGTQIAWLVLTGLIDGTYTAGRWGIKKMTSAGASVATVIDDNQINSKPGWSPDGEWIYFHRYEYGAGTGYEIHRVDPDIGAASRQEIRTEGTTTIEYPVVTSSTLLATLDANVRLGY